jgi:hypothetical protein
MVRLGQGPKSQEPTRATANGFAVDQTSDESVAANKVEHYGHLPVLTCQECTTYVAW